MIAGYEDLRCQAACIRPKITLIKTAICARTNRTGSVVKLNFMNYKGGLDSYAAKRLVKRLLNELPQNRDWLDPDLEMALKAWSKDGDEA